MSFVILGVLVVAGIGYAIWWLRPPTADETPVSPEALQDYIRAEGRVGDVGY